MNLLNVFLCLTSAYLVNSAYTFEKKLSEISKHELWELFNELRFFHKKTYNSTVELYLRFNTFLKNYNKIMMFNNIEKSHYLRINKFFDLTEDEFNEQYCSCFKKTLKNKLYLSKTDCSLDKKQNINDLPESVDWRLKNAVTPIKNQGNCGSCWSFSATGAIEGAWAIKYDQLYSLSEQQMIDCSRSYGNFGCQGGEMESAFKYAIDYPLCTEEDNPYYAENKECINNPKCTPVVNVTSCSYLIPNDQQHLKEVVFKQPVSVAIEADASIFQFYQGGVITDKSCGTNLNHGVLIVGYGIENDTPYWLIKNSWGKDWGDNGYVKILRSDDTNDKGICGIAMDSSIPIV